MTPEPAITDANARSWKGALRQVVILTAIMLASLGGYLLVLKTRGPAAQITTHLPLDEIVPFEPAWVWVYLIPYILGPLAFGLMRPATFRWYIRRGIVLVVISLAIFAVVPTRTAARPTPHLGDGLTAKMYKDMVEIDEPPANAAPSLHVSLTCLLALALLRDFPRGWWLFVPAVLAVWLATLLTRQHHLIDVVSGAALAIAAVWCWPTTDDSASANVPIEIRDARA
ncbi:MAG: hypothetical protein FJ271_16620 [Planctomycetes bacterium]|nr:hypothetical protein [Planctomycetota bacterium]